jgi:hypothetical protein
VRLWLVSTGRRVGRSARSVVVVGTGFEADSCCDSDWQASDDPTTPTSAPKNGGMLGAPDDSMAYNPTWLLSFITSLQQSPTNDDELAGKTRSCQLKRTKERETKERRHARRAG